ncbi:MAG TPA: DUF6252 family protein [Mucilaginibacter sp.]
MKKILFAASAFLVLFSISCKKNNQNPVADLFIGATKNNSAWIAQPSTGYFANRDSLTIRGFHATGEETIVLRLGFKGKGSYILKANQALYETTVGLDAITSSYKLDTTKTNTLTVTSFNPYTNIATGSFTASFVKTYGVASYPNNISFTNGKFWIELPD